MSIETQMIEFIAASLAEADNAFVEDFVTNGPIPGGQDGGSRYLLAVALRKVSAEQFSELTGTKEKEKKLTRTNLQKPIEFVFWLLGLVVAWQAVRFCQGLAPIPLLDKPVSDYSFAWLIQTPLYYIVGAMAWLTAALFIMFVGKIIARIAAVGFRQFVLEAKASWVAEQELARTEADRQKRRELRRKLRQEKSEGDAAIAFIIGSFVGAFFF